VVAHPGTRNRSVRWEGDGYGGSGRTVTRRSQRVTQTYTVKNREVDQDEWRTDEARVEHERVAVRLLQASDVAHHPHAVRASFDEGERGATSAGRSGAGSRPRP
jgi:hypothetical protein